MPRPKFPKRVLLRAAVLLAFAFHPGEAWAAAAPGGALAPGELALLGVFERDPLGRRRTREEMVGELLGLGPVGLEACYDLACGEVSDAFWSLDPEELWSSHDVLAGVALETLGRAPASRVVALVDERRAQAGVEPARELATLRVVERLASPDGLELVLEIAATWEPVELRYPSVRTPLVRALAACLGGVDVDWPRVRLAFRGKPVEVAELLLEALVAAERPGGVPLLEDFFDRGTSLELAALRAARALLPRFRWCAPPSLMAEVRRSLGAGPPAVRREAAITLGTLVDEPSFLALAVCLEDSDAGVRSAARWALTRSAGTAVEGGADAWQAWYRSGRTAWRGAHDRAGRAFSAGEAGAAIAAMRALAATSLHRHEAALALLPALDHPRVEVVLAACEALGQLQSAEAVPALASLLFGPEEAVRTAAWRVLRRFTGAQLAPDAAAWERWVHG